MEFTQEILGIALIPWQRWLLIHTMELLPSGRFRFRTILILVARQNGKTTLIEAKNLWKLFVLGVPLIIGTAQDLDIAEESWDKALEIIEDIPDLDAELAQVCKVNGKKFFRLHNGARWKIKATSRRAGRGLSGDDVNLDELREHQTWDSWGAVTKTTLARANAQIFGFSNAGDDKSVVLNGLRRKALAGTPEGASELESIPGGLSAEESERFAGIVSESLGVFEWSAPKGCPIDDPIYWAMANPSLGYTIEESSLRDALTDPEAVFRTECLCQHVTDMVPRWRVIPATDWTHCEDPDFDGPLPSLALEVDYDRSSATVMGAGAREDGRTQVGVIEHRPGTEWVVPWAAEVWAEDEHPPGLVVDPKGPAGPLIPALKAAGVNVIEPDLGDLIAAYAGFTDGCRPEHDLIRHCCDGPLDAAVKAVDNRTVGDRLTWDRKGSGVAPVIAASLAAWKVTSTRGGSEPCFAFV